MDKLNLRIAARASQLAFKQVEEVISSFPGLRFKLIPTETFGDKHKQISLMSQAPADIFTRELDRLVLQDKADIAIHSAKDVPVPLAAGLEMIALTKAEDQTDALVSKHNKKLGALPRRASIGASSLARKTQLLKSRPDLRVLPVRGTIEERLALLEQGKIDALVVATCALKRLEMAGKISEILPFNTHPLQGMLAVTAKSGRAELKVLFSRIDVRRKYGKVYLVGAGCGCKDFLTRQADKVLAQADIIFYDDLIGNDLLHDYAAEKYYVGKRKGKHSLSQQEINDQLYSAVQQGKMTVRLKGGDPLIFSRGGEELAYLGARHVDIEIIPGISAFQGAAAGAGIPLTMRGLSSKISLYSGHRAKNKERSDTGTSIYFMGASRLKEVGRELLKKGVDKQTPVALIQKAGFSDESIKVTSVGKLPAEEQESPLLLIAGQTAALYRERKRILFTGLDPYHCLIPGKIVHYPLIEIKPLVYSLDIGLYDGLVFTSKHAVRLFCEKYRISAKQKLISIGPYTSRELEKYGYKAELTAEIPDSDELAGTIRTLSLKKILYPCSDRSRNALHDLKNVEPIIIYKTLIKSQPRLDLRLFSGIVFTSPSAVDVFFRIYRRIPRNLVLYVYGRHTAARIKKEGYCSNVQTIPLAAGK